MSLFDKVLISILVCSAIFCLLSMPRIFRRVPRNPVYGYRTQATLSSDTLRYEVNAYFGSRFLVTGVLSSLLLIYRPKAV